MNVAFPFTDQNALRSKSLVAKSGNEQKLKEFPTSWLHGFLGSEAPAAVFKVGRNLEELVWEVAGRREKSGKSPRLKARLK